MQKAILAITSLAILSVFNPSCKEKSDDVYNATITGILMDSCGGHGIPSESFEFWDEGFEGNIFIEKVPASLVGSFKTDNSGRFEIKLTKRLYSSIGFIKHNNNVILRGEVLDGEKTESDLGTIYTIPHTRKIKYKITKGSDFDKNDYVAISQSHSQNIFLDTARNLSGQKTGIIYHHTTVAFPLKVIDNLAEGKTRFLGSVLFKYDKNNNWVDVESVECDTAQMDFNVNL